MSLERFPYKGGVSKDFIPNNMEKKYYKKPFVNVVAICLATTICSGQQPTPAPAPGSRPGPAGGAPARTLYI